MVGSHIAGTRSLELKREKNKVLSKEKPLAKIQNARLLEAYEQIAASNPATISAAELCRQLNEAAAAAATVEAPAEESVQHFPAQPPDLPSFSDLSKVGLLGCGTYGHVELVRDEPSGRTYALKTVSKGRIVKQKSQHHVRNERLVLSIVRSPFIMSFHGSYNTEKHIHYLLEPLLGGELMSTYERGVIPYGSEVHARYYIASVALALEHLHSINVICRGVMTEECVLDPQGHLKLCDLGIAKVIVGKTFTTSGAPEYAAPEILEDFAGVSFPADWWALGVMLFDLMAGERPFQASTVMNVMKKVQKGIDRVHFPKAVLPAKHLIRALMRQEPKERLPAKAGGVANLKGHMWFEGFSWASLEGQTMQPPYRPVVQGLEDLSNFDATADEIPEDEPYADEDFRWDGLVGQQAA